MGYYPCKCHSEVINIERDIDVFEKGHWDASIYFAIYHYGTQNPRPTFRNKLRHCWQILKTGKNYPDNIILSTEDAKKLGDELITLSDRDNIEKEIKESR